MTDAVEETTEGTSPAEEVRTDSVGRKMLNGGLSFKVPDGHPDQGKKIDKTFDYVECVEQPANQCPSDESAVSQLKPNTWKLASIISTMLQFKQAFATIIEKEWNLNDLVNDKLRSSARSNVYQSALAAYLPTKVSAEAIRARMIKDMIRSKIPEALATKLVDAALAQASTS